WSVKIKDPNAWSYPYSAWMPYSLEYDLVRGIYIHYSSTYGAIGPGYIGSHGCINIGSLDTARTLFNRVPLGAAVYVY
ncbi:MAG: L,D-transpeptidase, partial [Austwickia sp.]|nr:L,D-transpeptidase [Austwickia sp.]